MSIQIDPEIYLQIQKNGGKCLCQIDTPCPCLFWKEQKRCRCGLFVKSHKIKKQYATQKI